MRETSVRPELQVHGKARDSSLGGASTYRRASPQPRRELVLFIQLCRSWVETVRLPGQEWWSKHVTVSSSWREFGVEAVAMVRRSDATA